MSRKWLLFLFCLGILLTLVPPSRAGLTLRVNESATRVRFEAQTIEVSLAVENPLPEVSDQNVQVELVDPENRVRSKVERTESIGRGKQTLRLFLPINVSKLPEKDRRQILWYRLHYRFTAAQAAGGVTVDGVVSLSEITPDLFEVRVAASEMAHEGMQYRARVQAIHPITQKSAGKVRVDAVLTLETDDDGNGVKLQAAGVTDSTGQAILTFALPARFPEFPHELRPAGGSIKVTARRGALITEVENDVLVDQFPRMLISTDKPLYQPGQRLHMRVLVLSPTRHALANQDVLFRIEDPENTNVFRETVKSSRFGIASVDWSIPENMRLGDYWIKVALGEGEDSSQTSVKVRISRYDLPDFAVKAQPDRAYYLPGQNAEVKVSADYLFGRPVTHGHVRVVRETEREWNYQKQKWDIEEGDKYEGDTDANGVFVAQVKLTEEHDDFRDQDYRRFRDVTYAAYFTDPTTNRTEQRRFDLRLTKDPIHVYVIRNDDAYRQNSRLPLRFYVSTFYADGSPAQCRINVSLSHDAAKTAKGPNPANRLLTTLRTNRYGLGKVSGLRLPDDWNESDIELKIIASDSHGKSGSGKEEFELDEDENELRVETDKSLYRPGEPIAVSITSSISTARPIVDVGRDAAVLASQTVRLNRGRASITIPYQPEFKDRLTIAAYADFADTRGMISTRTILYPRDQDLRLETQRLAKSYRPGDEAQISLRVRGPDGAAMASALGLVIVDKAVDERFRTDAEFGNQSSGFYGSIRDVLGPDEQIAGVTLRDLQHLDLSKPVPSEMELVAEVLLNQNRNYYPVFFGGDSYEKDQQKVFADPIKLQLTRLRNALTTRYTKTGDYPGSEAALRGLLLDAGINFDSLRDPWGDPYRPVFSIDKQADVLSFTSAGADKRFDTDDDFSIESNRWAYFRSVGEAIDRAVRLYHKRTGGFIRDFTTLRTEVAGQGPDLEVLLDRWNRPYRFDFHIDQTNYVIKVRSGGADQKLQLDQSYFGDDFVIWTSAIDYFAEARAGIDSTLAQELKSTKRFPQTEKDLREVLRNSDQPFESLRDPWGHSYYASFKIQPFYADRVQIENRGRFGEPIVQQTQVTPVTKTATVINLRSMGADGKIGTADDFNAATFAGVFSEQTGSDTKPRVISSPVIFSGTGGALTGVVMDPNGAAIPGVSITATNSSDVQTYSTLSNDEGKYTFANLPSGLYDLRLEFRGFMSTVITNVLVRSSNIIEVNVMMEPGGVTQTVTVSAEAPSLQTQSANFSVSGSRGNAGRYSRLGNVNVVTKSGGSQQLLTPRLREYFPETLVWWEQERNATRHFWRR